MVALEASFDAKFDAGNVAAAIALIVSVIALARPWWNERKATISVRNEHYQVKRTDYQNIYRYIVKNHGPARAHDVEVKFDYPAPGTKIAAGLDERNTPLLHVGEELYVDYNLDRNDELPERVVVSWRDGRRRRQSQEFYPSMRRHWV